MAIPGQTFEVIDPGLGVTPEAINTLLFVGCSEKGSVDTLYVFSRIPDVVATLGQGPLSEALCTCLANAGGPVFAVRLTGSTAGAAGSVTKSPAGTSTGTVTVAGAAFDSYEVILRITKTGTLGAGEFIYSLDDGYSWSESLTIPTGGTFAIPNTNLTLTFVPGAGAVFFEVNDLHSFDCTAPFYSAANLSTGMAAVLASTVEFAFVVLTGAAGTSSAGATLAAAAAAHAASLFNQFRFIGVLAHSGADNTTTTITSYASVANARLGVAYSYCDQVTHKPFTGWTIPRRPTVDVIAAHAGELSISTDLGRVASGALEDIVAIEHDEARTGVMDSKRFMTLRTIQGREGFYVTQGRLMSPSGSDYKYWQHRRCMDVACDTAYKVQVLFMNRSVRTNEDGSIDELDARTYERAVKTALSANLLEPNNAEGTPGHVSALDYTVDRANNIQSSETLLTDVAIRPRGYVKHIVTQLGYSASVGG